MVVIVPDQVDKINSHGTKYLSPLEDLTNEVSEINLIVTAHVMGNKVYAQITW